MWYEAIITFVCILLSRVDKKNISKNQNKLLFQFLSKLSFSIIKYNNIKYNII